MWRDDGGEKRASLRHFQRSNERDRRVYLLGQKDESSHANRTRMIGKHGRKRRTSAKKRWKKNSQKGEKKAIKYYKGRAAKLLGKKKKDRQVNYRRYTKNTRGKNH